MTELFSLAIVPIDGRKSKTVNRRDRSFSPGKPDKRQEQIEHYVLRYLGALDTATARPPLKSKARPNGSRRGGGSGSCAKK